MNFLLEIYSEEIPSRMQKKGSINLEKVVSEKLVKNNIYFKKTFSFSTPRRLALVIEGLKRAKTNEFKSIKGPSADSPDSLSCRKPS